MTNSITLKLTSTEIDKLINYKLDTDRFKEIFDDIPMYHPDHVAEKGETHRDYIEDDGREYRWYIFKDTVTGIEHTINYTYSDEWPNDFMDCDTIEIVDKEEDSDLYVLKEVKPPKEHVETLTPEQADKELWAKYKLIQDECRKVDMKEHIDIPKERIDDIFIMMNDKTKGFSMIDLRSKIIPLCIEYRLEQKSFWKWVQSRM